jgi:hypothetical protein
LPLTAARSLGHRLPKRGFSHNFTAKQHQTGRQQARAAHRPQGCRAGRGKSLTPGLHVPHGSPPVLYRISRTARLLEPPPITAADVCRSSKASPSHRLGDQGESDSTSTKSKPAKATAAFRRHGRRRRPGASRRDLPATSGPQHCKRFEQRPACRFVRTGSRGSRTVTYVGLRAGFGRGRQRYLDLPVEQVGRNPGRRRALEAANRLAARPPTKATWRKACPQNLRLLRPSAGRGNWQSDLTLSPLLRSAVSGFRPGRPR